MILRSNTYSNNGCWSEDMNSCHFSKGFHSLLWNIKDMVKGRDGKGVPMSGVLVRSFVWKNILFPQCWKRNFKSSKLRGMS